MKPIGAAELKEKCKTGAVVFVLFYWNMCGHCHELRPIWNAAVRKMSGLVVAEVENADIAKLPGDLNKIRAFPTMCIVKGDKIVDTFMGSRDVDSIVAFVNKYAKPTRAVKSAPAVPKRKKPKTVSRKSV